MNQRRVNWPVRTDSNEMHVREGGEMMWEGVCDRMGQLSSTQLERKGSVRRVADAKHCKCWPVLSRRSAPLHQVPTSSATQRVASLVPTPLSLGIPVIWRRERGSWTRLARPYPSIQPSHPPPPKTRQPTPSNELRNHPCQMRDAEYFAVMTSSLESRSRPSKQRLNLTT